MDQAHNSAEVVRRIVREQQGFGIHMEPKALAIAISKSLTSITTAPCMEAPH